MICQKKTALSGLLVKRTYSDDKQRNGTIGSKTLRKYQSRGLGNGSGSGQISFRKNISTNQKQFKYFPR